MTKKSDSELKVALAQGFHGGRRVRRGDTFTAPKSLEGRWFKPAGSGEAVKEALSDKSNILNVPAKDVKAHIAGWTSRQINEAIGVEQGSGSPRRGVLKQLQDELANRVGETGGPDPAAKQPEEKDPLTSGGEAGDALLD